MAIDDMTAFVRAIDDDEDYFLTSEVAWALDVTRDQLRRLLERHPQLRPMWQVDFRNRPIPVWTLADVTRVVEFRRAAGVAPRGKDLTSTS